MDIKLLKQGMIEKQAAVDCFPNDSVVRDEDGRICAASTIVNVTKTPAPLFGYDVRDEDFAYAMDEASKKAGTFADHNFGACCIMRDSIAQIEGTWYGKVSVPKANQRHIRVTKYLVKTDGDGNVTLDENGKPTLLRDDEGKVLTTQQIQKEGFLLVPLADLEADLDHPMSAPFVQVDTDLKKQISAAVNSHLELHRPEKAASSKKAGKRVRLSNAQLAAVLSSNEGA